MTGHGLMMPMPDIGGGCWYCAQAAGEHTFVQVPDAEAVRVCLCGRWPGHHMHTGDRAGCTCDACKETQ